MSTEKQTITISLSGLTSDNQAFFMMLLGEFMEFTGFETSISMLPDPSDEELIDNMNNFQEKMEQYISQFTVEVVSHVSEN